MLAWQLRHQQCQTERREAIAPAPRGIRGRLMAGEGGDRGSMLAALAPVEAIEAAIREEGLDLIIANRNTPRQSVLSGPTVEGSRASTIRWMTYPLDTTPVGSGRRGTLHGENRGISLGSRPGGDG